MRKYQQRTTDASSPARERSHTRAMGVREGVQVAVILILSNPVFLPTAYSPAVIYCGRERGWWITCWLKSVLHEEKCRTGSYSGAGKQTQKKKCRTGSYSGAGEQTQKKNVGRHLSSEQNGKFIMSDEVRRRIGKG